MLLNGVPMPWMGDWGTSHPIFVSKASGNRVTDIDGNEYVDFCLGDTGAMFGHSPQATAEAVAKQVRQGITTMMPTKMRSASVRSWAAASVCRSGRLQ